MLPDRKGKSPLVIQQLRQASYERTRVKLTNDIRSLMDEQGITDHDIATDLGIRVTDARERINSADLTLRQLIRILDCLGVELYPILSPRRSSSYSNL